MQDVKGWTYRAEWGEGYAREWFVSRLFYEWDTETADLAYAIEREIWRLGHQGLRLLKVEKKHSYWVVAASGPMNSHGYAHIPRPLTVGYNSIAHRVVTTLRTQMEVQAI